MAGGRILRQKNMVLRSILLWLLLVAAMLFLIMGTVEAWPWIKKYKNANDDRGRKV
jgi:hypothetical protein